MVGAAIGFGMAALAAERGGADFLLAVNAGRYRVMGASSLASVLPLTDATSLTESFARNEILGRVSLPVLLGVVAPRDGSPQDLIRRVRSAGFAGVANFPSVIHMDRRPRQALEDAGLGFIREAGLLAAAREAGLIALGYARTRVEVATLLTNGVDAVCLNFGWTAAPSLGASTSLTVGEAADTLAPGGLPSMHGSAAKAGRDSDLPDPAVGPEAIV